jgi:glycosyltransferase involved in cell wall biosynthesis
MKVCLATYQSVMLLKGGPSTQILQTKRCLEKLGVEVCLFESWGSLDKQEIDLVHLFGANIGTFHFAREIHKLGIPLVVTPIFFSSHSVPTLAVGRAVGSLVHTFVPGTWSDLGLLMEICSWAKAILPNTAKEARLLEGGLGLPAKMITTVPNGADERFYHATPDLFRQRYGIDRFILNVGHIGPGRKNVARLIEALEKINHPAVIIGRIEDNVYGRRCVEEAKKNPRILMLDSLPNDSELLASAYAACDVFVLPSLFETPGIAALEAALAGAKIVITKNGGTEEYFGNDAEYVEPTSWELIHHGIISALNKEKDNALRERVRKEFIWECVAEKTLGIYKQVSK